jgi:hypothetical protein
MNNLLQINLFCAKLSRFKLALKMVQEIEKISDKSKIKLCIYGERKNINLWSDYFNTAKPNFKVELIVLDSVEYRLKVDYAHRSTYRYSCKMDDDVLMSYNVWEFIIDNLDKITQSNPVIAPIFTNGIPSADMFVKDFLNAEDIQIAHSLFLAGSVNPYEWGLDYSQINSNIRQMSEWCDKSYWSMVSEIDTKWDVRPLPWYYYMVRGVHPARYSHEYNMFIAKSIFQNKEKFFSKQDYKLETYKAPYFCNNLFVCETNFWRESFKLFNDGWDEGQLTLKMGLEKSAPLYIRNGFAIHMAYGMTVGQQVIEDYYISNLY